MNKICILGAAALIATAFLPDVASGAERRGTSHLLGARCSSIVWSTPRSRQCQGPGRGEIERQTLGWPSRVPPRCPRPHGFFVAEAQERLRPSMHGGNAAAEAKCCQLTRSAQAST